MHDALLSELQGADTFEDATRALLGWTTETTAMGLLGSEFASGRVLRAMLHLRPAAGYSGLSVLDRGETALGTQVDGALLPSATAWQTVVETLKPVAVDVVARNLRSPSGERREVTWRDPPQLGAGSHQRLMKRGATHLYVLPLIDSSGPIGLVSIEVACVDASLHPTFVWPAISEALVLGVALAVPFVTGLPRHEAAHEASDELLPVIGQTMTPIVRVLRAFAGEDETLLVHGETGTGKSRIARWCHARSERAAGPFETLDLLGVPEETQMGELFGWKRGAFTGAVSDHQGFVERAEGGTLFIDEVDKLNLKAQAALLTLLEDRRYRVLGDGGSQRTANLRFIIGTNVDLAEAVREGRFREDLYYRLNVLPMTLPPLRERRDEIADWARFLVRRRQEEKGRVGGELAEDALLELERREWPGNLRELDNVLRRALALASIDGGAEVRIEARHLGVEPRRTPAATGLMESLIEVGRGLVDHGMGADLRGLELPGALHGVMLAGAVDRAGGREEAFEALGRGELIGARNHHRVLKRDVARAAALCERIGQSPPPALAALINAFDV